jgi:hypothetical protein
MMKYSLNRNEEVVQDEAKALQRSGRLLYAGNNDNNGLNGNNNLNNNGRFLGITRMPGP